MDLRGLLDDDDAIHVGIWAASAFSSVVLPVPVPPEIRMFCCVATALRELRCQGLRERAPVDEIVEACTDA